MSTVDALLAAVAANMTPSLWAALMCLLASASFMAAGLTALLAVRRSLLAATASGGVRGAPAQPHRRAADAVADDELANDAFAAEGVAGEPSAGEPFAAEPFAAEPFAAERFAAAGGRPDGDTPVPTGNGRRRDFRREIDFVRKGGDPRELRRRFHLSRVEAHLLTRLYGTGTR